MSDIHDDIYEAVRAIPDALLNAQRVTAAVAPILERALADQRNAIAATLQEKSTSTKVEAAKTPSLGYLFGFADCYYQAAEIARDHGKGGAS